MRAFSYPVYPGIWMTSMRSRRGWGMLCAESLYYASIGGSDTRCKLDCALLSGARATAELAMKITVKIDEKKLSRLMRLTGIRTKTRALDFALSTAERNARRNELLASPLTPEDLHDAVDSAYDVLALREKEKPHVS